jgi:hypothetical protein
LSGPHRERKKGDQFLRRQPNIPLILKNDVPYTNTNIESDEIIHCCWSILLFSQILLVEYQINEYQILSSINGCFVCPIVLLTVEWRIELCLCVWVWHSISESWASCVFWRSPNSQPYPSTPFIICVLHFNPTWKKK